MGYPLAPLTGSTRGTRHYRGLYFALSIGSNDSHTSLSTAEEENFFAWMSAGNHRK
ncbi:hypothetical protein ACWGS9_32835 [Bradyrhizobium sp. Arg314]